MNLRTLVLLTVSVLSQVAAAQNFESVTPAEYATKISNFLGGDVWQFAKGVDTKGEPCEFYAEVSTQMHSQFERELRTVNYRMYKAEFRQETKDFAYSLGINPYNSEEQFQKDKALGGAEFQILEKRNELTARSFIDVCSTFVEGSLGNECFVWSDVTIKVLKRNFLKTTYSFEIKTSQQVLPHTPVPNTFARVMPACIVQLKNFRFTDLEY